MPDPATQVIRKDRILVGNQKEDIFSIICGDATENGSLKQLKDFDILERKCAKSK